MQLSCLRVLSSVVDLYWFHNPEKYWGESETDDFHILKKTIIASSYWNKSDASLSIISPVSYQRQTEPDRVTGRIQRPIIQK